MKPTQNHTKAVAPKGDRLKWTALKDVKPVHLTNSLTKGTLLTSAELKKLNKNSGSHNTLIP